MPKEGRPIPKELLAPSKEFAAATKGLGFYWWYWDHIDKELSISPDLLHTLGYAVEEFNPGEPSIYKNIHPEDVKENAERVRRLIYGEIDRYEMEFRIRNPEGEWQWFYNRGVVLGKEDSGKATLIGGITMDISGQYQNLMSKLEQQEKFEFIFRNSTEAIVTFELRDEMPALILDANEAALTMFGKSEKILNQPIPEDLRQDRIIGKDGAIFKTVREKGFARMEHEMILPDGRKHWIEFRAHAFNLTGKDLLIAMATDITEGRKTEKALRETELLYKSLFDAADDPIGLFSIDRQVILINKAFHNTFGYSYEEFMSMEWMVVIHPEDRLALEKLGPRLVEEGHLVADYRVLHKDGRYRYVSSKSVIIPGETSNRDMILTIVRDMTERRQAMEDLERARQKAEESDRLKSAFLANMSHEIRTPMNSIVGFSNLLVKPSLDEDARKLYVSRIVRNSEMLLSLISDIIDLAKIESGQLPLVYGKQNLGELITDMEQFGRDELLRQGKEGVEIKSVREGCHMEIDVDVVRLVQIMKNLVNNAIKFTETGEVCIGCRRLEDPSSLVLFVKDTGIGISPEDFTLIFDQFRQVDGSNTRQFGGTGLGLAICRNLAEMMGGRIWVESSPGEGTVFQVELPIRNYRDIPASEASGAAGSMEGESQGPLSILVVDDEQDSRELLGSLLEEGGHEVHMAASGYDALHLLEQGFIPALVFMDVKMPVLSGRETMNIMRDRQKGIRFIAQSAHALVGDRVRFLEEGFDDYLPKPFSPDQLGEILRQLS